MDHRYQRHKKLRAVWKSQKNSTEKRLIEIASELAALSEATDRITSMVHKQDALGFLLQHVSLAYLMRLENSRQDILIRQKQLQSQHLFQAKKEKSCELIGEKIKVEIKTSGSAAELNAILELIVRSNKAAG